MTVIRQDKNRLLRQPLRGNPQAAIILTVDMIMPPVYHIRLGDSCEGRKQKHIPHEISRRPFHLYLPDFLYLVHRKPTAFKDKPLRSVVENRVLIYQSLIRCPFYYLTKWFYILVPGLGYILPVDFGTNYLSLSARCLLFRPFLGFLFFE
jgi:hypothetical protein